MPGYISPEGASLPASSDNWDIVAHMRTFANSQRTVVPVADRAAGIVVAAGMATDGRTVTPSNPLVVYRADTDAIETFDGTNWWGAQGFTNDNTAWASLTLNAPWVNYVGGGGYRSLLSCRVINDRVEISGIVKSGATGTSIATLPTYAWPTYTHQMSSTVNNSAAYNNVTVNNTGDINYTGATAPGFVSINLSIPMS